MARQSDDGGVEGGEGLSSLPEEDAILMVDHASPHRAVRKMKEILEVGELEAALSLGAREPGPIQHDIDVLWDLGARPIYPHLLGQESPVRFRRQGADHTGSNLYDVVRGGALS